MGCVRECRLGWTDSRSACGRQIYADLRRQAQRWGGGGGAGRQSYLERRRAEDNRELEQARLASEHTTWLRDQRLKAYQELSRAGEDGVQFVRQTLRSGLSTDSSKALEEEWRDYYITIRKAYNKVILIGTQQVRAAAEALMEAAQHRTRGVIDRMQMDDLAGIDDDIRTLGRDLGRLGDAFLDACRSDLQHPAYN